MTDLRKAAEMALEALETIRKEKDIESAHIIAKNARYSLREALAQPEQEPVANTIETVCALLRQAHDVLSLSSLPTSKPWVGLSDTEAAIYGNQFSGTRLVREIEAVLKERNSI